MLCLMGDMLKLISLVFGRNWDGAAVRTSPEQGGVAPENVRCLVLWDPSLSGNIGLRGKIPPTARSA